MNNYISPWEYIPCKNGHIFIWTSNNTDTPCPDGILCECGQTVYSSKRNGGNEKSLSDL